MATPRLEIHLGRPVIRYLRQEAAYRALLRSLLRSTLRDLKVEYHLKADSEAANNLLGSRRWLLYMTLAGLQPVSRSGAAAIPAALQPAAYCLLQTRQICLLPFTLNCAYSTGAAAATHASSGSPDAGAAPNSAVNIASDTACDAAAAATAQTAAAAVGTGGAAGAGSA